ncbi:MAG: NADH-quinone oxidoreductase subunit J [Microthrixaceae bacterium]|nr:NADH-quinone oxidoreductase subunit J [Microthrixaceae bacterium]HPB45380.1 NADH-quinone oxidoreductase subunit J [Microthrixaceae bacterium]
MSASAIATLLASDVSFALPANIAFGITAAVMVYAALRVVTTKNVVHAALWLIVVLLGVAVNFVLLQAEFLAATQVMVYVGAIVVLLLFGVMLTRAPLGVSDDLDNPKAKPGAILIAIVMFVLMAGTSIASWGDDKIGFVTENDIGAVSDSIFGNYLVPFEVVSVLLLAALIGAIVLARKD